MACGITFITCDRLEIHGLNETSCTAGCHCDNVEYQPLCSMDGVTNFISPCHAGCKSSSKSVEKDRKGRSKTLYWGCECAREISVSKGREVVKPWWAVEKEDDDGDGRPLVGEGATSNPEYTLETMVDGYCQTDCTKSFYMLLGTFAVFGIFAATTRLPGFVVNLRSVEKRDKAAALSLQVRDNFFLGLIKGIKLTQFDFADRSAFTLRIPALSPHLRSNYRLHLYDMVGSH